MPRPAPDYIPEKIRQIAADMGVNFKELALRSGLNQHRFYSFFSSTHGHYSPYLTLAQAGGITLEELREKIKSGEIGTYIDRLISETGVSNITRLARELKISPALLLRLVSGKNNGATLDEAAEIAEPLKLSIDELLAYTRGH